MIVLHAIHDFLPRHRAGSELYALALAREQARRHHVSVVAAEYDPARAHGAIAWRTYAGVPVIEIVNNWLFRSFEESYRSPWIDNRLRHVLDAVQPDVLHVHNLLNLSFRLPGLARARGVPVVATLHDYTLVCPSGGQRVHVAEEHVCDTIDPERCARCFAESPWHAQMRLGRLATLPLVGFGPGGLGRLAGGRTGRSVALRSLVPALAAAVARAAGRNSRVTAGDIELRLARARELFDEIDLFVAPSAALAREYVRLGLPEHKLRVSDYGFRPIDGARVRSPANGRIRVGFVGTFVWHKGVHVLLEAIRRLPPDRVDVRLHGDPDCFPSYGRALHRAAEGLPVRFMGPFDESRAADVYAGLDVLVVPSLWPENSPLVIHEAFMAGVPVVGARVGGIPELVEHGRSGLIYDSRSPEGLAAALRSLIDDPSQLARFQAALPRVKPIDEDARWWESAYASLAS